jgi:hypothetical protein
MPETKSFNIFSLHLKKMKQKIESHSLVQSFLVNKNKDSKWEREGG